MVLTQSPINGQFRSQLGDPTDLQGSEVWIRCADVYAEPNVPAESTGFELGLEAFHVFEPPVKSLIDPERYASLIETLELGLESSEIVDSLRNCRTA